MPVQVRQVSQVAHTVQVPQFVGQVLHVPQSVWHVVVGQPFVVSQPGHPESGGSIQPKFVLETPPFTAISSRSFNEVTKLRTLMGERFNFDFLGIIIFLLL